MKPVPDIILNASIKIRKAFFKGYYNKNGKISNEFGLDKKLYFKVKNKLKTMSLYFLCKTLGYKNLSISFEDNYYCVQSIDKWDTDPKIIKKIEELRFTKENEFVYDLETETGNFQAGIGEIIVKNTDSVFLYFETYDKEGGKKLIGKDALKKSIQLSFHMERKINYLINWPKDQFLEYEKTFWPFILFSKKRYVGNKYEFDHKHYKQISMGVVTKRRDNATILKMCYGGILDRIMNNKDIPSSIDFLQKNLRDIANGNVKIENLIITKTLRGYYKCPDSIAHKVLAERIGERSPGNKPKSNDRIPYVFIKKEQPKGKRLLQGDKIEDPTYIIKNNIPIDYNYYITNQISKPVCQIYALIVTKLKQYKDDPEYFIKKEKNFRNIEGKTEDYIKTKIQQLKMKKVEDLLFRPILEQIEYLKAVDLWSNYGIQF